MKTMKVLVTMDVQATSDSQAEMKVHALLLGVHTAMPKELVSFTVVGVDDSSEEEAAFLAGLGL
jgi:hypothetical protein